jgi:hypothetical protein
VGVRKLDRQVAQRDALGQKLIGIAHRIADETITAPRVNGRRIVPAGLSSAGGPGRRMKTFLISRIRHGAEDSQQTGEEPAEDAAQSTGFQSGGSASLLRSAAPCGIPQARTNAPASGETVRRHPR